MSRLIGAVRLPWMRDSIRCAVMNERQVYDERLVFQDRGDLATTFSISSCRKSETVKPIVVSLDSPNDCTWQRRDRTIAPCLESATQVLPA